MFDGLLKTKFYSRCKSDIKQTRARVDLVKKKRNAMQKYLRNDIADLLINGQDIIAYGRAEGLLVEMDRTSCYEFVDKCCEHVSTNVSAMDKQKECPDECREAVSSLMFAAARFADTPELRELRNLFSERYGDSLGCFINKEFAEKMKSSLPSKESKFQLLQEIAAESGLDWDSKALENKLYTQPTYNKNLDKKTTDRILRSEGRPPRIKETPELKKLHQVPPVKDIRVDTIAKIKKPKDEEELVKEEAHLHEKNEEPLGQKTIPLPPYTKLEPNKPNHDRDDLNPVPEEVVKPVPKSVRRSYTKPAIDEDDRIQQTNKEKAEVGRRTLRFLDDNGGGERDDEEKMMDRLLRHYSKKHGPSRIGSLDHRLEESKKHNRTLSLDSSRNGHVHPKMPEYEDFVARLAELRRNLGNN